MPRGEINKVDVDKEVFMDVVKKCGSSITKLGEHDCKEVDCSEKTIRRALNRGRIPPRYLEQIAKYLNVDTRLLSGELHKQANSYNDEFIRDMCLAQLKVENYPYYRKRKSDLDKEPVVDLLERILALFEISFSQYEAMDFEKQYLLQHDLFDALVPVIRKHFEVDAYGRKDMPDLERIIYELENYRDTHYQRIYADEVLRKKFLEKPPHGKTKADIRRMDAETLIALNECCTND